jgi:hypothetical protein
MERSEFITGPMMKIGSMVYDPLPLICSIFLPLILGVEAATFIAMPFGPTPLMEPEYWFAIVSVSIVFVLLVPFIIGFAQASWGILTFALVVSIIAMIWQLFMIVWWIILLITCDGTVECADNLDYMGVVTGVFTGPTTRFLVSFIFIIVMFFVEFMVIAAEFRARRILYLARAAAAPIILAEYSAAHHQYRKRMAATKAIYQAQEQIARDTAGKDLATQLGSADPPRRTIYAAASAPQKDE